MPFRFTNFSRSKAEVRAPWCITSATIRVDRTRRNIFPRHRALKIPKASRKMRYFIFKLFIISDFMTRQRPPPPADIGFREDIEEPEPRPQR